MAHAAYSCAELDFLAHSGVETLCFEPGKTAPYDVEAGARIQRIDTPGGTYTYYESSAPQPRPVQTIPAECVGDRPYLIRAGGFRRDNCLGPDEAARQFKHAGIQYADGLGNGLFETLLLCRKHGIWPIFEAPTLGLSLPFLKSELPAFEQHYRAIVRRMKHNLRLIEQILGSSIVGRRNQPWPLWLKYSPLQLYLDAVTKHSNQVAAELNQEIGIPRAPVSTGSENQRVELARFWSFIRRRHAQVLLLMAQVFREEIVAEGLIIGNMHSFPPVDFHTLGRVFDHPGVAVRPCYLSDQDQAEAHVAFAVKMFHDLTGKPPITSVRTNLLSAGSRIIPGANCLKTWFNAALRSGSAGFYFWPRDYPSTTGSGYDGPMCGNPDDSARGPQRWNANLTAYSQLTSVRHFRPPSAEVSILLAHEMLDPLGWRQIFDCYRFCERAAVWVKFVSNAMLEDSPDHTLGCKLLLVPHLPFCSERLSPKLTEYLAHGGHILTGEPQLGTRNFYLQPNPSHLVTKPVNTLSPDSSALRDIAQLGGVAWYDKHFFAADSGGLTDEMLNTRAHALNLICAELSVDPKQWVYRIGVDDISSLTGKLCHYDSAPEHPEVELQHYYYEHSSEWILPYIQEDNSTYE